MADAVPCVYILNGDDDYAIDQVLVEMLASLGDATTAEMNTTRLDGSTANLDQLLSIAGAMPFLARRRLVILTNPLAKLNSEPAREKFRGLLEQIPSHTGLALVQYRLLTEDRERKKNKIHWLERWATESQWVKEHPGRVLLRTFPAPKGPELTRRIVEMAKTAHGTIDAEAAARLAELTDGNLRIAAQEIDKLLAYVNYRGVIRYEDVEAVTADINQGDVFELVDALSARNGQRAMNELERLMSYNSYYELFGMVVRQFRLLIQAREIIDRGGRKEQIRIEMQQHPFVAEKLETQARRFQMAELEDAFKRLVDVDLAVKTSQAPEALALEYFVSSFTTSPEQSLI